MKMMMAFANVYAFCLVYSLGTVEHAWVDPIASIRAGETSHGKTD